MTKRKIQSGKDRKLRLVVGLILLLVGLFGFSMMSMMGVWHMGSMLFYGYLISIGIMFLGGYLTYDGLRED